MKNKCEYQNKGLKRDNIDKYYTSNVVVERCIEIFKNNVSVKEEDLIIEPSAGDGAFIPAIESLGCDSIFMDIEPENSCIIKQDYLDVNLNEFIEGLNNKKSGNIHVIGNPPFGRQSSLAIRFIKRSCEYCDTVSFILPRSFKKESMRRYFPLNFHCLIEEDIIDDGFIVNGLSYDVPCVFQVWVKKMVERKLEKKLIPYGYTFVKKTEFPDVSFRRVGVNAGNISKSIDDKSEQSHYFIRFNRKMDDNVLKRIFDLKYDSRNNTVGPCSISKQELIREFNSVFVNIQ